MGLFDSMFRSKPSRNYVSSETKDNITREWEQIEILLKGGKPSQLRQALIKADKSLDNALRDVTLGESMGERLKNSKDRFEYSTYDRLWKAHKIRNKIVHEAGFEPPHHSVEKAIRDIEKGLTKLGVSVWVKKNY